MNYVTKDLLEALNDIRSIAPWEAALDPQRATRIADEAIARAETELALQDMHDAGREIDRVMSGPDADADGWINPNDKTQKQYLPHIGEKVLFCYDGVTYYGKHTGGSFHSFLHPRRWFNTWDCLWMYPPKAKDVQP